MKSVMEAAVMKNKIMILLGSTQKRNLKKAMIAVKKMSKMNKLMQIINYFM